MIYLASSSPRRAALLTQVAVEFTIIEPHIDESAQRGEPCLAYVQRMAREKSVAGCRWIRERNLPSAPVLAADTIVVLNQEIIRKPGDDAEAKAILRRLSGREHEVVTALCLDANGRIHEALSSSRVTFGSLSDGDIDTYCRTGEPLGKAGGYAIQGRAALFVRRLEGSYSGVMGLPLFELGELLSIEGLL